MIPLGLRLLQRGRHGDRISAALGGTPNGETLRRNFGTDE
jgi:hypothetical protein